MAALMAKQLAQKEGVELRASSFGLYAAAFRGHAQQGFFDHHTRVFVMEQDMECDFRERYGYQREIICLNVDDRDEWSDRELEEVFRRKFADEGLRRKILYV